jgi:serine/threonine-protein kinase
LAEDSQMPSKRLCLIKQLKPINDNPQVHNLVQERFEREAAILEKLSENNPQIPKLYAYFAENNQFYLVEEFIEGETLSQRIHSKGAFTDHQVKEILVSILRVLIYVHGQKIIHRDIKPDNIILRFSDNLPLLIDFGAVKETMGTLVSNSGHSLNSIVIGTPGFMPSEQAIGRPVYSSDLYALGLTAIYLLTGKTPEMLESDPMTGKIYWRQLALDTNISLAAVLDKAISPRSNERYSTAKEMLDALQTPLSVVATNIFVPPVPPAPTQVIYPVTLTSISNSRTLPEWVKAIIIGAMIGTGILGGFVLSHYLSNPSKNESISSSPSPDNQDSDSAINNEFPKPACGDENITDTYYRVVVTDRDSLERVKNNFCQDAFVNDGNIQVATFNDLNSAQGLQKHLIKYFDQVKINQGVINASPSPEPVYSPSPKPVYSPVPQRTFNSISRSEAVNLIERWLEAKRDIFGSSHQTYLGEELLTGKAYDYNIKRSDGQESSSEWLANNGSYYIYGVQRVDSVDNFTASGDQATIDVVVTEERTLYNNQGKIDRKNSAFSTSLVRYNLQNDQGQWKIAHYRTIKNLVRR